MNENERIFPAGTPVRCNRSCSMTSPAPREFRAIRENSNAWRIQDMFILENCGHMDGHWVFNSDLEKTQD